MALSETLPALRLLALGDSYTIGEAVDEHERFPVQLAAQLSAQGLAVAAPRIVARTGWTTDELAAALALESLEPSYDRVSLLIGVNNQYRGYNMALYAKEFEELLLFAIEKAAGQPKHVVVVSIPDYGVTPFAAGREPERIAREIDAYNAVNKQVAERYGTLYADITPISRQAATQPELIATDGLHPSGRMYAHWVSEVLLPLLLVVGG